MDFCSIAYALGIEQSGAKIAEFARKASLGLIVGGGRVGVWGMEVG